MATPAGPAPDSNTTTTYMTSFVDERLAQRPDGAAAATQQDGVVDDDAVVYGVVVELEGERRPRADAGVG